MGTAALAAPVNGTGDVTPTVIFGSGNANGSFTGVNENGVELGLRGKLRYNTSGVPENTFNYDGDKTYTFTTAEGNAPADKSVFNFEWAINTDPLGTSGQVLNNSTYLFEIDFDPTAGTNFLVAADPINVVYADHFIGNNSTVNGGGAEATGILDYQSLIGSNNVAQNSGNFGWLPVIFDPQTEGMFTFNLSAFDANGGLAAMTSIDIIYGDVPAPVPLPAALPLLLGALGGMGFVARRRRKS